MSIDGIGLAQILGPQDQFTERATIGHKKELERVEDKVSINQSELAEVSKLQILIGNLKVRALELTNATSENFDQKKAGLRTSDVGISEDYISVTLGNEAALGVTTVGVEQVATSANLIIGRAGVWQGFDDVAGPQLDGTITLTVDGQARNVVIAPADSARVIVNKMNTVFSANNDEFEALIISDQSNNTSYIEVRSKNTGLAHTITEGWAANDGSTYGVHHQAAGANAIIRVDGIRIEQDSNKFENVKDGITIELTGKPNDANGGLKTQTINVIHDSSAVLNSMDGFIKAYNILARLVAKHSDYTQEDAVLNGSNLLIDAQELLATIDSNPAIYQLGLGIKEAEAIEEGPATKIIYLENKALFERMFKNDFAVVHKLFVNDATITANVGNLGSTLLIAGEVSKQLPNIVNGVDIPIAVTLGGGGVVTAVAATVGGAQIIGNYDAINHRITFPDNSPLSGLGLYFHQNAAANNIERFTFNFTHGIANLAIYKAQAMISDDGRSGSTIVRGNELLESVKRSEVERVKAQENLDKETQKIKEMYERFNQLDMIAGLQIQHIEAILGVNQN